MAIRHRGRVAAAVLAACLVATLAHPANAATSFSDDFSVPSALGSFSDCAHNTDTAQAYCGGLTGWYRDNWWAYPNGWPDTATQRGYPVGGIYDPANTVWVDNGQLHIRMYRDGLGPVHAAAVVPKGTIGARYGTFSERFRVSRIAPGYKSAHLLWPLGPYCDGCEINHPEGEWTGQISAFSHPRGGGRQGSYITSASWSDWHVSTIEWSPGSIRYLLDGHLIGQSTTAVPDQPMMWVLQNESALDGEQAAPDSWAQLDIDWVRAS